MTVILRDYGHTKRCHTQKVIHTQSVAEHSHGVALFCAQLYGGKPSANLLLAALYHDLPESVTGDVPAPAKWRNKPLAESLEGEETTFMIDNDLEIKLTSCETFALKLADLLDLGFYCIDELNFGNRHVENMYHVVDRALRNMHEKIPEELRDNFEEIYNELYKRYDHVANR